MTDDGDVETVDSLDDALEADHRTVLVLADAATARRACLERFATTSGSPDRLLVLFEEPLERWLDGSNVPDRLAEAVSTVAVGERYRSAIPSNDADHDGGRTAVRVVPDPADVERVTDLVEAKLEAGDSRPGGVWVHSLGTVADERAPGTAVRFAREVAGSCARNDVCGCVHLDPSNFGEPSLRAMAAAFDRVVRPEEAVVDPPSTVEPAAEGEDADAGTTPAADGRGDGSPDDGAVPGSDPTADGDGTGGSAAGPGVGEPNVAPDVGGGGSAPGDPLTVAAVGEGDGFNDLIATFLEGVADLDVVTVSDREAVLDRLGPVDCVVAAADRVDHSLVDFHRPIRATVPEVPVTWPSPTPEAVSEPPGPTRVFERSRTGYRRLAETIPDAVAAAERPAWDAVEHMPEPTFLLAPDGTIERTGVSPETWPGADGATPGSVAFPEQFAGDTIEEGLAAARDGEEWTETLDVGDGPVPSRVSLSPAGEGRAVATVVAVSEYCDRIRELRAERDRIEQATQLLSHDFRNLMMVIDDSLERAQTAVDRVGDSFDRIEARLQDTAALTGEAAIDSVAEIELERQVRGARNSVRRDDATLRIEGTTTLYADEGLFERLLENLLNNAVTHATTWSFVSDSWMMGSSSRTPGGAFRPRTGRRCSTSGTPRRTARDSASASLHASSSPTAGRSGSPRATGAVRGSR